MALIDTYRIGPHVVQALVLSAVLFILRTLIVLHVCPRSRYNAWLTKPFLRSWFPPPKTWSTCRQRKSVQPRDPSAFNH